MRKILLVAKRDYLAAIRSKPFLLGLVVTPILAGSGFLGIGIMKAKPDTAERRLAIVDRTGVAAATIIEATEEKNTKDLFDKKTGRQVTPRYAFEIVAPDNADPNAQRLALSERVRRRELFAFLEVGRDAVHPPRSEDSDKVPEASRVNYYSNTSGIDETRQWITSAVSDGLRRVRMAELGVDKSRFSEVLSSATLQPMELLVRDPKSGQIEEPHKRNEIAGFIIPFVLVLLLMMMVLVSSGPMLGAVAEDKMQRVYEMLLASATPFELIMGKVVGAVWLSVTSSVLYLAGGLLVLEALAMIGLAPVGLFGWFAVYLVADVMVLCAFASALGAACSSPNDAQHLAIFLMAPVLIPMLVVTPVMRAPNGIVATVLSLVPPFTPLLMLMRQAMPGGVPAWQPWAGLVGVMGWTVLVAWAAARIFRIGILMQGKTATVGELFRWALRG